MTTLPEEAVTAAASALRWSGDTLTEMATAALTAALPFLPVQVAVKKLEWTKGVVDIASPHPGMKYVACSTTPKGSWAFWLDHAPETRAVFTSEEAAKAAAQADYEARILSALEPSTARELALEEIIELCRDYGEDSQPNSEYRLACNDIIEAIQERRALSSPDHADAGKVEGDGLERAEFHRGYVLACANIVNLHGADVAVMEGFAQLGISKAELKALDLCEYDQRAIDALEEYFGADKLYQSSAPSQEVAGS